MTSHRTPSTPRFSSPVEPGFASRSARYLARSGYRPNEVRQALIEELRIPANHAERIVAGLAA